MDEEKFIRMPLKDLKVETINLDIFIPILVETSKEKSPAYACFYRTMADALYKIGFAEVPDVDDSLNINIWAGVDKMFDLCIDLGIIDEQGGLWPVITPQYQ